MQLQSGIIKSVNEAGKSGRILIMYILAASFFLSCSNSMKSSSSGNGIISEDEAKKIVAKDIAESDYYQQYYVTTSKKYDERVAGITWGNTVLVTVIPDGRMYQSGKKYYLLTGVLPDGQVLAAQTVDAQTGQLEEGALLIDKESDILRLASASQCSDYAARMGYAAKNIEAVFYFDGTIETEDQIYSWKYCINTKNNRSLQDGASVSDCVFIDPWIN
ncbi:MAG: hypothetical protein M0P01_08730 [Treponema sp.]|nr:hypothetical protein [Treponema sp.]